MFVNAATSGTAFTYASEGLSSSADRMEIAAQEVTEAVVVAVGVDEDGAALTSDASMQSGLVSTASESHVYSANAAVVRASDSQFEALLDVVHPPSE
jgi:hypothetical protein